MKVSTSAFRVGILAMTLFVAVLAYHSIRKACCAKQLSDTKLERLVRGAERGDVVAMRQLYFYFDEVENPVRADIWLKRAASAGDPQAQLLMYDRLFSTDNGDQRRLALDYLMRAAKSGLSDAQAVLGESYRDGRGVPKSNREAMYWLRRSVLSGDPDGLPALCEIALLLNDMQQCEECLRLNDEALMRIEKQSYLAKQLRTQRERITIRLGGR